MDRHMLLTGEMFPPLPNYPFLSSWYTVDPLPVALMSSISYFCNVIYGLNASTDQWKPRSSNKAAFRNRVTSHTLSLLNPLFWSQNSEFKVSYWKIKFGIEIKAWSEKENIGTEITILKKVLLALKRTALKNKTQVLKKKKTHPLNKNRLVHWSCTYNFMSFPL